MNWTCRLGRVMLIPTVAALVSSSASAQQLPQITSITGYSDGVGVSQGRWTGQPTYAPANASNRYRGFLAAESYDYGGPNANPYYWDINGRNFGATPGTVTIGPNPSPFVSTLIVSWTPSLIRLKVAGFRSYTSSALVLTVRTAPSPGYPNGLTSTFGDYAVGIIKSRGCGQCTWFVAKTRLDQGLAIPPRAYSYTNAIPAVGAWASDYRPARWDCLLYGTNHVAIITSPPTATTNSDGSTTWTFTVSEYNAVWDENFSSSARSFKLSKADAAGRRTILVGIGTNASRTWIATHYFR